CGMPDLEERREILRAVVKSGGLHFRDGEGDRIIDEVASRCEGYSGADLHAVLYNAHLEAVHAAIEEAEEKEHAKAEQGGKGKGKGKDDNGPNVEFMEFPFDPSLRQDDSIEVARTPAMIAERARLVDKLTSLKARNAAKLQQQQQQQDEDQDDGKDDSDGDEGKIYISWENVESALGSTRPSISREERRKLERIYKEFVGDRKGDLKNADEVGREVGGRASLM